MPTTTENLAQKYKDLTEKLGQDALSCAKLGRKELAALDARTRAIKRPRKANRARCGAKTRAGEPCQAPAVKGGDRCRVHGGKPFDGIALHAKINRRRRAKLLRLVKMAEILSQ